MTYWRSVSMSSGVERGQVKFIVNMRRQSSHQTRRDGVVVKNDQIAWLRLQQQVARYIARFDAKERLCIVQVYMLCTDKVIGMVAAGQH